MALASRNPLVSARGRSLGVSVRARFGGRDSDLIIGPGGSKGNNHGGNNGNNREQKLIIPGQQQRAPGGQRLMTPDKKGPRTGENFLPDESTLGLVDGPLLGGPPTLNKYRPPAGFMNETLPEDATARTTPQEMLNKLQARAGHWHELAKYVPSLNSKGYSSTIIDELTGITPLEQNKWLVSATVYESVKAAPGATPELLERFNGDGVDLLYPFRFLSAERRVIAAQYIAEQNMSAAMCEVLSRSMKEYERRALERPGFSDHPADCLAFKYLRDAVECRKRENAVKLLQAALKVALTEGAKARVLELMDDRPVEEEGSVAAAPLTLLRLEPDELGVRPVCVIGELGQAEYEEMQAAPRTSQGGAFGIFRVDAGGAAGPSGRSSWDWVALPQWRLLSMARHPVALTLRDCSTVEAVLAGCKAKSDDDLRRLQGPGILVCDRAPATFESIDPAGWYLGLPERGRALVMVEGRRAVDLAARGAIAATVLLLARPPVRDVENRGTDLLQL